MSEVIDLLEVEKTFGVLPQEIGLRFRAWWIVSEIDEEEERGNAKPGYLCVKSRDGASNPIDMDALKIPNCVGTSEDDFDRTYRYYFFSPLAEMDGSND